VSRSQDHGRATTMRVAVAHTEWLRPSALRHYVACSLPWYEQDYRRTGGGSSRYATSIECMLRRVLAQLNPRAPSPPPQSRRDCPFQHHSFRFFQFGRTPCRQKIAFWSNLRTTHRGIINSSARVKKKIRSACKVLDWYPSQIERAALSAGGHCHEMLAAATPAACTARW
jgi:hypothetical protein